MDEPFRTRTFGMAFGALVACLGAPAQAQEPDVSYELRVRVDSERALATLDVTMTFVAQDGASEVALPRCRYGTPQIWGWVEDVHAEGATLQVSEPESETPYLRRLRHEPGASVRFGYTMAFDPDAEPGVAYRPSVGAEHFHFFDPQWRARLRGLEGVQRYRFAFAELPEGWSAFSNLGPGAGPFDVERSPHDLSAFIAGGADYAAASLSVGSKPIQVRVRGFADTDGILASLAEILPYQGEAFGPFSGDHYLVCLSPRDGIRAGTAIDDAFVCLADPTTDQARLEVLLAHEFFHNWLPRTAWVGPSKSGTDLDSFRFDWFQEGFTEYAARRMLLESGHWDLGTFVERFNGDLREQARNPQRAVPLATIAARRERGSFSNFEERTSYFRGPLIALLWERQLLEAGEVTLLEVLQSFVARARAVGGAVSEAEFFDLFEEFGLDARGAYQRHIVAGEPPQLPADMFGADFRAEPFANTPVDLGFDAIASRRSGKVVEVSPGGPAARAGLRDGMELLEFKGSRRLDQEVVLRVRDAGEEKVLRYLPVGAEARTRRFVRRAR